MKKTRKADKKGTKWQSSERRAKVGGNHGKKKLLGIGCLAKGT